MCVADPEEMRVRYAIDADGEKPRVVALFVTDVDEGDTIRYHSDCQVLVAE